MRCDDISFFVDASFSAALAAISPVMRMRVLHNAYALVIGIEGVKLSTTLSSLAAAIAQKCADELKLEADKADERKRKNRERIANWRRGCNALQSTNANKIRGLDDVTQCNTLQMDVTQCNVLQSNVTQCNALHNENSNKIRGLDDVTRYNTLQDEKQEKKEKKKSNIKENKERKETTHYTRTREIEFSPDVLKLVEEARRNIHKINELDLMIAAKNCRVPVEFAKGEFREEMEARCWQARNNFGHMYDVTRKNLASVLRSWYKQCQKSGDKKNPAPRESLTSDCTSSAALGRCD